MGKKRLLVNASSGVSGNMFVGALLHAGVPVEYLKETIESLHIHGYELIVEDGKQHGLPGVHFDVNLRPHHHHDHHGHHHHHDHDHDHDHDQDHHHSHEGEHGHHHNNHEHHGHHDVAHEGHCEKHHGKGHHHHRGYTEIRHIIEESHLPEAVKQQSIAAFYALAKAEAEVHESTIEEVHFHEVGAVDCIIDIVGTMACLHYLGIDEVQFTPLHVGQGKVHCEHGLMDVPTPATEKLLKGLPYYVMPEVFGELVTPTGATLVRTLSKMAQRKRVLPFLGNEYTSVEAWEEYVQSLGGTVAIGHGGLQIAIPDVLRVAIVEV